jgi:hypothetical protein
MNRGLITTAPRDSVTTVDFDTPAEPFSDFSSSGLKCQLSLDRIAVMGAAAAARRRAAPRARARARASARGERARARERKDTRRARSRARPPFVRTPHIAVLFPRAVSDCARVLCHLFYCSAVLRFT